MWLIDQGSCGEVLATCPSASVDALVTDPPAGIGFMGREWDKDKGGAVQWIQWLCGVMVEARRVLKPGAHGLVWALPRTSHWTAMALELAGFEIRDVVTHIFATGFPKSLDIGKAFDAAAGAEREIVGRKARGGGLGRGLYHDDNWQPHAVTDAITLPTTPLAQQWDGWGTALKPASEHWILVRAPLDGTTTRNVERWGTGGLNIDACRIAAQVGDYEHAGNPTLAPAAVNAYAASERGDLKVTRAGAHDLGRWPANVVFSHTEWCGDAELGGACIEGCPVLALDQQSGVRKSGSRAAGRYQQRDGTGVYGACEAREEREIVGSLGGASRFFFCAKPSPTERDFGLDGFAERSPAEVTGSKEGAARLASPRTGAGRSSGRKNHHPTVKSIALMRYLCRLVTPPGGIVLDPFSGSGTTGCAATLEGLHFLGIEQDPEYAAIARARIGAWEAKLGTAIFEAHERTLTEGR